MRFAAVARVSEVNHGLYRTLAQPVVQALASQPVADLARDLHPNRLRFAALSDRNPMMKPVKELADAVRKDRRPVSDNNPLLTAERMASSWITSWWEGYRQARDAMTEATFLATYGSPLLQAMVGLGSPTAPSQRRIDRDLAREAIAARRRAELETRFEIGGLFEAVIRSIMHIRLPQRSVDERGFHLLQALCDLYPANRRRTFDEMKSMFRDQYLLLRLDEERAVRAIPHLLPQDADARRRGLAVVRDVTGAAGDSTEETRRRLERIVELFNVPSP